MNNYRKKKILILSFLGISLFIIAAFIQNDINIINRDIKQDDDVNNIGQLKVSGHENPIEINGSATGVGAHNWTWAQAQPWCTGNGTENEPYIIEDIIINGVGSNQCIGIYESNEYFIIRNCTFYNSRGTAATDSGIKLLEVTNGKILNSYCLNNTVGIYLFESSYNTIAENSLYNNSYYGIQLYDSSSYNTISDNTMNNNYVHGLTLSTSEPLTKRCTYNTIIKNNLSYNENKGILLHYSDNNNITENLISFNEVEGMYIKWSNANDVYKNYFLNNTHHAEDEEHFTFPSINYWDNTVIGNYWDNHTTGDADGDGIDDNAYTYITGALNPVDNLPIYGNPFHDGSKVHIDGNQASGNKSWTWSSTRAWCSGSGASGDPYIISDLIIDAVNDGSCILIGNSSVYFKIENSKLLNSGSGSMDAGIKLDSVSNAQLIGNNCSNNQYGISLYLSDNNNVIENTLHENYYGVCLNNSDSNTISENTFVDNTEYALEENSVGNTFENNYCIPPLTIADVTSTNANGTYRFGDTIEITIEFSDIVYVTGTPQLTLETGDNDAVVGYTSGSGTNILSFNYTVALDHNSTDLDYISTGALDLNSGTIKGIVGNDANITLPVPGTSGSLGSNKNIIIDAKTPSVNNVSSTKPNGFYTVGEIIEITITFSEIVYVTGTPQLTLETGSTDAIVDYTSGNETDTLTFTYTVVSGHTSTDLDYVDENSLTGTIKDSEGLSADLALPTPGTAGSLGSNKNLVIDTTAPTITSVSSTKADGTYGVGEIIEITITFSESVDVTGTPRLTLETGTVDAVVDYTSGSGTSTLTFTYTVASGHTSPDLDYFSTNALSLNGGTIEDEAGNNAVLTLPTPGTAGSLGSNKNLVIDTTAPTITGVSSNKADGTYTVGEIIEITITFSESVDVTGTPRLTLETGAVDAVVDYTSGSGTSTLTFTYTVASGHTSPDLDYTSTNALSLNGGTIEDAGGNNAVLTLFSPGSAGSLGSNKNLVIDTTAPTITGVSSNKADGTYTVGEIIEITITFSESVDVTGTPRLTLETGAVDAVVDYTSGSGTSTLTFTYTVASGHTSSDLDYTSTSALSLNGGTIEDAGGNNAVLTLFSPGSAGSLGSNKNLVIDTTAPTITGVSSNKADGTYTVGEIIEITITFSESVDVTGTPRLILETGAVNAVVDYTSGSGTSTLTFTYTVASGHTSSDLDYTSTSALSLNGGTIEDEAGNNAVLTLPTPGTAGSLGFNKDIIIDTEVSTITGVSSTKADGTYGIGEIIEITITFSESVDVTGTPRLTLETGAVDAVVDYTSGSGTSTLTFTYTVASGHTSSDLDYTSTSALSLNGGTIEDAGGNSAVLTLPTPGTAGSLGSNKNLVIDTTAPTITGVSSTKADGTYTVGEIIEITITFSESVDVTGTPRLTLETGTVDAVVDYTSGSGTSTLTFTYTVASGHTSPDLDYTSTNALSLNGGTIEDGAGNSAVLTLPTPGNANSLGSNKDLIIDTTAPTITSASSTIADGGYTVGEIIEITITFSESVDVTGTPQLTLETGTVDAVVDYTSGSGTSTLTFTYTVASGHNSSDLDYISTDALSLNGGTIEDGAGNSAVLTLPTPGTAGSLGSNKDIIIDTEVSTITGVSSNKANGTYGIGEIIEITITFSESVDVTGTPQLTLETGAVDAVVDYTSGSGTSTLTFTYTVASGHTSSDLDYISTNALSLNGGTIEDIGGNNANLTLPTPGTVGSLGSNKNIILETISPTITNVSSTTPDGTYGESATIEITITFSESVYVTGTPQLTLETGSVDAIIDYTSGSGTTTLVFTYVVASGDISGDLGYESVNALSLNGGSIKDSVGNDAVLMLPTPGTADSLSFNKNLIIDTVVEQEPDIFIWIVTIGSASVIGFAVIIILVIRKRRKA